MYSSAMGVCREAAIYELVARLTDSEGRGMMYVRASRVMVGWMCGLGRARGCAGGIESSMGFEMIQDVRVKGRVRAVRAYV